MNLQNDNRIFLSLASASANYTKPDAVMDAFTSWLGQELPEFACMIHRLEVYADLGNEKKHKFVSLGIPWRGSSINLKQVNQVTKLILTTMELCGNKCHACAIEEEGQIMELRLEAAADSPFSEIFM